MSEDEQLPECLSILKAIGDTTTDAIYAKDLKGRYLFFNKAAELFMGKTSAEVLGKDDLNIFPAETAIAVMEGDQKVIQIGKVETYEEDLILPSGQRVTFLATKGPIFDDNKKVVGLFSISRDITLRKKAEEALRQTAEDFKESQAILQVAMDQSEAGIAIAEAPSGVLRYVNDAGLLIRGGTRQSVVNGVDVNQYVASWKLLDLDGRPLNIDEVPLARAVMFGETCSREFLIRREVGDDRVVFAKAAPIKNPKGEIIFGVVVFMDITERKKAELSLRELSSRLRFATAAAKAGVWDWNLKTGEMIWDDRMLELYGLARASFPGGVEAWKQGLHPDDAARAIRECEDTLRGEKDYDTEFRVRRPDGSVIHVKAYGLLLKDAEGKALRMIGLNIDITEKKQAEDSLASANARLEALWSVSAVANSNLKMVADHILATLAKMTLSEFGFYGFINETESIMTIHSWSGKAMESCSMVDKPLQFRIDEAGVWAEAIRRREPFIMNDYTSPHPAKKGLPQGHVTLTNLLVVPHFVGGRITAVAAVANRTTPYDQDDVQQISSFLNSVQAIVESKQAEKMMRESEEKFQKAFCSSPIALGITNINDGRFLEVNKSLSQVLGFSTEEMIGHGPLELNIWMNPGDRSRFISILKKDGFVHNARVTMRAKSGKSVVFLMSAELIDIAGQACMLSIFDDITEKELAEARELELRVKLERATRLESLGVLAGGVAHDLNNVLGPIVVLPDMVADFVKRYKDQADPEYVETLESLRVMKDSALRAAAVISDLVVMGRRGQIQKVPLNLNLVVEEVLESKQIRTMLDRWPYVHIVRKLMEEPAVCLGSESRLIRVLANLVGNAIEAVEGLGDITIRTSLKAIEEAYHGYETVPAGKYITIEVSDTGCGIDSKTMVRIFEPFFSTKRPSEKSGSGLGLSVVYGLVKDHGGFLDVKSEPGKGTIFTVYLPAVDAVLARVAPVAAVAAGNHERILVVDDEAGQQLLSKRALKKLGYDVTVVSTGEAAVKLFQETVQAGKSAPFDLMITDMVMEELDGMTLCQKVLQMYPGLKLIIASGHAAHEKEQQAKTMNIDWLVKPYTAEDLASAVRACLERR